MLLQKRFEHGLEHGAYSVLKGRILPEHREHRDKNACSK